jgi:hypothetical protein
MSTNVNLVTITTRKARKSDATTCDRVATIKPKGRETWRVCYNSSLGLDLGGVKALYPEAEIRFAE